MISKDENRIWMYWHQGHNQAPDLVQKCIRSWHKYHPGYDLCVLDKDSIDQYLEVDQLVPHKRLKSISLAGRSDIIRIHLLEKYGGIWVDCTLMCLKPIESWLNITNPNINGFFAFSNPGTDRMVASWFLADSGRSYIAQAWASKVRVFWSGRKWRRPYYWFHYLFNELYDTDSDFRNHWDNAQKMKADGPHYFVPFRERFFERATDDKIANFEEKDLPVVKLTYKCIKGGYPKGSMIDYILNEKM